MHTMRLYGSIILLSLLVGCGESKSHSEEKGIAVEQLEDSADTAGKSPTDTFPFVTQPNSVLLTDMPNYRLIPVFKVNFPKDKEKGQPYISEIDEYWNFGELGTQEGNNWNNNYLPGLEAVAGHLLVNASVFNTQTQVTKAFFEKPVIINTLYYPAFSKDTLYKQPVHRNYYLISAYDEDTNHDRLVNRNDLRRFYAFDADAHAKDTLVPLGYSVQSSEYDPANDYLLVHARLDENKNGRREILEPIHVFFVDLKDPHHHGRMY